MTVDDILNCGLRCALCLSGLVLFHAQAAAAGDDGSARHILLDPADYAHYVERFNAMEDEPVVNLVPNADSWAWIVAQAPLFDCPSARFEEIY
jgi:hypothetical protein